jgi:leucyl aminopeptidase
MTNTVHVASWEEAMRPGAWDALVVVSSTGGLPEIPPVESLLATYRGASADWASRVGLVLGPGVPGGRLVLAPTGPLDRDWDDVRRFGDAARAGVRRARDAGARSPLLVVHGAPGGDGFEHASEVALLEGVGGLWEPLEAREGGREPGPVERVGFLSADPSAAGLARRAAAVEDARGVARDVAGTEPERMSPARVAELCRAVFANTAVRVGEVDARATIEREYPLIAAVARASYAVPRHAPRVIRLEYTGDGNPRATFLFAGKGVVYDTGGSDLKVGGHMAGMSRDKSGAAGIIGLFVAAARLRPANVRLIAELGMVRNSPGPDAYVTDEILTGHSGVRVRVGNTDAEGRLVLADLLSHLRRDALESVSPVLFSVATLTGHAGRAVGQYGLAVENGPAREAGMARALAESGDRWGDPFEVTRSRREDFDFIRPRSRADDVLSCNNDASVNTARGHQFPMAFLTIAAGLAGHGAHSRRPLPWLHLDIGGSAFEGGDWQHGRPTATPVLALSAWMGWMDASRPAYQRGVTAA